MYRFVKAAAGLANIHISKQSARLAADIEAQTRLIGRGCAAETFAHYIANHDALSTDASLAAFMRFYGANWKRSASQWSQDIFVMYALDSKRDGCFLEIGGADGFTHSNTYALEKHLGWRGTLVEPDPGQFKVLQRSREGNTLIHAAISPRGTNESVRLRRVGQLSSLEGHEGSDMHSDTRGKSQSFATVRAISLTELLAARTFDYFSLDVEGAELEILRNIDWSRVRKPRILTIEHNFREQDRSGLKELLTTQGYIEHFEQHDWLRRGDLWATLAGE